MGKKSKRNRERISDNEEEARTSKKLKLEVPDVINFEEDYEVFLIKKPMTLDINLLHNSNVTTADSSSLILGNSHYELTSLPATRNMRILKQPSSENEISNRFDVLNFKVEGILSMSPSLENLLPSMAIDPKYDLPNADDLRQRYKPFGIADAKTMKKRKKHKH